jgi:hypothetical protein
MTANGTATARTGAPARAPAAPQPRTSRLGSIRRGRVARPPRCLFYGPEGVGKSSLAGDAPDVVFVNAEDGLGELDVARYEFRPGEGGDIPLTLAELYAGLDDLAENDHPFRTVAVDTLDAVESRLLWPHVCKERSEGEFTSIESFGYGKGFQFALDEWRIFLSRLDRLRNRGIGVILLGHSWVKSFKNPEGEDYDRYQLKLHDKAAGLIKEWCEVVGFLRFEEGATKLKGDKSIQKRARGWSSGRRIMHLARTAAWDAKSRLSLPEEIELDRAHPWRPFAESATEATDTTDADVRDLIERELARLGDAFTSASGKPGTADGIRAVGAKADRPTLDRILAGLRASESTGGTDNNEQES